MLLAGAIFTPLDEDAHQTGGHRPADVGFGVVADHRNVLGVGPGL